MAETDQKNPEEEPRFQRLGAANWLPEERKVIERYEERLRDLERRLATAEARAEYAQWQLSATKAQRPYRLSTALAGAKRPSKLVRLPRDLTQAMKPKKAPKAPATVTAS